MVMTRSVNGGTATEVEPAGPGRRQVARPAGVPGGRAVLGGVLVALAGVGMFVAWSRAAAEPRQAYAVAGEDLRPGDPLTADAVRFVPMDLPGEVAAAAFRDGSGLEGRATVAPIGAGELIQAGSLSDQGSGDPAAEVSLALPRERAVDGRLRPGDLVDVYGSGEDGTMVVAPGLRIVDVTAPGGAFADGEELTVTLAVVEVRHRAAVVDAASAGTVTLVRTTHVSRRPSTSSGAEPPPREAEAPPAAEEGR
jgi:Flp pilus assembly protein CpaB